PPTRGSPSRCGPQPDATAIIDATERRHGWRRSVMTPVGLSGRRPGVGLPTSAAAGVEQSERAPAGEVEGVVDEGVRAVLGGAHVDHRTLGGSQVDRLRAPRSLVALLEVHAFL